MSLFHELHGSNPPLLTNMNSYKLASSCPTKAAGTSNNGRRTGSDGRVTVDNPSAGVGAAGAIGSHFCEIPPHQPSPGVAGEPTASWQSHYRHSCSTASGGVSGTHTHEAVAVNKPPKPQDMKLKNRTFCIGTWSIRGRNFTNPEGSTINKISLAEGIMSVEKIDILVITETHTNVDSPMVTFPIT